MNMLTSGMVKLSSRSLFSVHADYFVFVDRIGLTKFL